MKNKKAISLSLEAIVVAILILVVLIVLVMVFTGQFGKEADYTGDQIDCLQTDADCDGVNDLIDKCCNKGGSDVGFNGCPPDANEEDKKSCKPEDCKNPKEKC